MNVAWEPSASSTSSASSSPRYLLYDITGGGTRTLLLDTTSSLSHSFFTREVGRDYTFELETQGQGATSQTATTTVTAKSFLEAFSWYFHPKEGGPVADVMFTPEHPFRNPADASDTQNWKLIVAYLNHDAPEQPELSTDNALVPEDANLLRVQYEACHGSPGIHDHLLIPWNGYSCQTGGLLSGAIRSGFEDGRIMLAASLPSGFTPSPDDFVTLAFYDFGGGGGGRQIFTLAAVDKTEYHFQAAAPAREAPTSPQNLSAAFDETHIRLNLSWERSTDPDSPDSRIIYEVNQSTSTEFSEDSWQSMGNSLSATLSLAFPNAYTLGVRAVDDFGNASPPAVLEWSFPDSFVLLPSQTNHSQVLGRNRGGGQRITILQDVRISSVALWLSPEGGRFCCSRSVLEVRSSDAGGAIGDIVAASFPVQFGTFDGEGERVFSFETPPLLSGGQHYWLVLRPDSMSSDAFITNETFIHGTESDSYPDGLWSSGGDAYFRLGR